MKYIGVLCMVAGLATMAMFTGCATPDSQDDGGTSAQVTNSDLASEVRDRLTQDSVTQDYVFGVAVEDGVVTLSGHVKDATARMRAVGVVRSTPGVKGVIDSTTSY